MTRAEFQAAANRTRMVSNLTAIGFILLLCGLLAGFKERTVRGVAQLHHQVLTIFPGLSGTAASGILIGIGMAAAGFLYILTIHLADRKLGVRCPHCERSLTFRCMPDRVLKTGQCCGCQGNVFEEEGDHG